MGKGQELLDAAREGDRKTVEKILGQITKRSGPFTSLRRGAGVNVQDDNGYTPLHHACLRGHKDIVSLLLSVDASPCVLDKKGATALHLAAWKGDSDVVSMLLAHANPHVNIDQRTSDQETALIIAAQFGNVDVVAQLLSRGADVTIRNIKDESALDLAAQYGRLETVQHLLRARPQLVDPYRFPVCRGRLFSATPLHRASKNGHKEVVSTLISAGVDANVRTYNGTALHEAANYGKASVVRILLAKGADLNAADRRGKTVHDLLNEYSEEATKRVRRIIREHMATSGYESEEDLPPFPVQDYSPTGYPTTVGMQAQETHKNNKSLSSSSSILTNKNQPQSLVKRLANKYLGIKAKFSSAPNIPNTIGPELEAKTNYNLKKSNTSNTVLIGNSKFFDFMQKKDDEVGEIVCNDEFDTVSLGRMSTLDRNTTVNRSNRSCPGFKTSLPNIAENGELSDSHDSQDSIEIIELDNENNNKCDKKDCKPTEAINPIRKLSIFEPRDKDNTNPRKSNTSAESDVVVNECYEPYEFEKSNDDSLDNVDLKPKPPPRPMIPVRKNSSETSIYENLTDVKTTPPKPAARTHIPLKENAIKVSYENVIVPKTQLRKAPEPPERSILILPSAPSKEDIDSIATDKSSPSISRSSTVSSESLTDEADFEDILLSKKSMSFRHSKVLSESNDCNKTQIHRTQSTTSGYSDVTEASAMDNVDVSGEVDDKSMYLSMTGTLPSKKAERAVKKKVLFRHKTFTNIELDGNLINKDFPRWNNEFKKETLANYHIRGTGHCIYKAPTVQEFIYIFNRDTLYSDVAPFEKVPNKRESYFETAICFCKPEPPKFHKSAEDLLELPIKAEEKVTIDIDALRKSKEMQSTSFQCFCDKEDCKFHEKKRESNIFVIKFSAIKKSISTPDITLVPSPTSTVNKPLTKNKSVPYNLEEPYAVVDIVSKTENTCDSLPKDTCVANDYSAMNSISQPSTISSSSRPYSIRDIAEEISMNSANSSLSSNASDVINFLRQSSSDHSGRWSLHTCNSNATVKSDMSFKSCLEEVDSSDDETLHSEEDVSDTDTVASVAKRPWVHSDSFRFGSNDTKLEEGDVIAEESTESGIETCSEMSPREGLGVSLASLERGSGVVRSGSGRRRWDEAEATSEGDALSVSSAASSCAPHHLSHHHDYNKVSPTPPKKPPRRNLSVSPTHANSPSSGYSYEIRPHARSQDDLDDIQGAKHYLKHGRSVDQYVDGKLSYSEYEENHNSPRVAPIPNPRPSLKNRPQPVAITAMYENVVIKEQNPRRKLRRNNVPQYDNFEPRMTDNRVRKYSAQEKSSLESLLDDSQSMNSPSDCERYYEGPRVEIPLSPSHYDQPPTPDHPPPSARQAENSIHERIRPLSQRIMEVIEEIRIRKKTEAGFSENSRS